MHLCSHKYRCMLLLSQAGESPACTNYPLLLQLIITYYSTWPFQVRHILCKHSMVDGVSCCCSVSAALLSTLCSYMKGLRVSSGSVFSRQKFSKVFLKCRTKNVFSCCFVLFPPFWEKWWIVLSVMLGVGDLFRLAGCSTWLRRFGWFPVFADSTISL